MKKLFLAVLTALAISSSSSSSASAQMQQLSATSIANVVAGMRFCSRWSWHQGFATQVESHLRAGIYDYVNRAWIDGVNDFYYSPCIQSRPAYSAPMNGYLRIIDQRVPGSDALLSRTDPRLQLATLPPPPDPGSVVVVPAPAPPPAGPPAPPPLGIPVSGGDLVHIGGTSSPISEERNFGQTLLSISAGSAGTGGTAGILMTARSPFSSSFIHQNGGDAGWRLFWNYRLCGPDTLCPANPNLGQIWVGFERDGSWSWTATKPQNTPPGPFDDGRQGKDLSIYPGGFNTAQIGRDVYIFSGKRGRGITIGLTLSGANNPTDFWHLDPDGTVAIRVDGAMRTVKSCNIGGQAVLCF